MALHLEGTPNNVFAIHANGTSLHFTLREFAFVTGLKCVGNDDDFELSEKVPNRLIETYFGGVNLVKKKHLMKCFADKNWGPDNDGDALKIALLYFIHTFIFSSEKNNTTIPRLNFDLVESGRYSKYHWGLKAFETLTKSISKKMDAKKKYYRIARMPLAMQVWFYECCSDVDPKIALRVDNVVPRILNWRTTGNQPNFAYLMNGMFNDKANMKYTVAYRCCIQMHTDVAYRILHTFAFRCIQQYTLAYKCIQMLHTFAYRILHIFAYRCIQQYTVAFRSIQMLHTNAYRCCIHLHTDTAYICIQMHTAIVYKDIHPTNIELAKKHVASIGPSSSPPHKKRKEHESHPSNTEYQSKIPPVCVSEFGQNALYHNQLADSKNDKVSSLRKDLNSFKEYVVSEFKSLRTLINDNFKMLSDHLQHNQQNESLHQKKEPIGRRDDGIDTTVGGTIVKLTPIFEKRHPFEDDSITGPHPTLIIQEYDKWVRDGLLARHDHRSNLEDHYKKSKSTLHIPLDFELIKLIQKISFTFYRFTGSYGMTMCIEQFLLAENVSCFKLNLYDECNGIITPEELLILNSIICCILTVSVVMPAYIDVIFYYLRKKGKYNQISNFKYTIVDCIFKTRIAEIFDRYADTDSNTNVAKEEDVVCEYIRGYRLLVNVPWHTVDNVLIPVNLKDKPHWVLVVVSFKERRIKVYDSYRSAGHDAYVASEIDKLAKLVPLYLSISGFYRDSKGID
ncbi:uncharacterized protein LOC142163476 [Nicotiana tabacum]|uniref:Uncharacterized protein LOC142163476 n=1 Tax=Nicotiana tabacum TaxID=4097 RepID=A0AC58RVV1_TOBAC